MHKIHIGLLAGVAVAAFMSEVCETVMITGKDGPVRMNKSDYDAMDEKDRPALATKAAQKENDEQEVVTGGNPMTMAAGLPIPPAPSAPSFIDPVAPPNPSQDTLTVATEKHGRKNRFFVVRPDGSKVEDMKDVDAEGYETEGLAWAAVMAAKREPALQNIEEPPHTPPMPAAGEVQG